MTKSERAAVVTAKCVGCGATREIRAGEIAPGDMPMCALCFMTMIAERAVARAPRRKRK